MSEGGSMKETYLLPMPYMDLVNRGAAVVPFRPVKTKAFGGLALPPNPVIPVGKKLQPFL